MSAIIGGCNIISLSYYDQKKNKPNEKARKLSQNISHILKNESFIDFVKDPGAGSYYIESLTKSFITNACGHDIDIDQHIENMVNKTTAEQIEIKSQYTFNDIKQLEH